MSQIFVNYGPSSHTFHAMDFKSFVRFGGMQPSHLLTTITTNTYAGLTTTISKK